jgi:hypothetical protein
LMFKVAIFIGCPCRRMSRRSSKIALAFPTRNPGLFDRMSAGHAYGALNPAIASGGGLGDPAVQIGSDVGGEIAGMVAGAVDQRGSAPPQKRQAHHIKA